MSEHAAAAQHRSLLPQHRRLLEEASGIAPAVIADRGYWSATESEELAALRFAPTQRRVPALVLPKYTTAGIPSLHEIRPDHPRVQTRNGKQHKLKYESPAGSKPMIDTHPRTVAVLGDPSVPLLIGEGLRKGDAALSHGFHCLNLSGVWSWRGTGVRGGKRRLDDFDDVVLDGRHIRIVFDSDAATNPQVMAAAQRLRAMLERRGASVRIIVLPPGANGAKQGLDDYLVAGGELNALIAEAEAVPSGILVAEQVRYPLTDLGNAERFVAQHREAVRYSRPRDAWHVWTGTHWTEDGWALIDQRAKQTVRRIYREAECAASDDEAKAILEHARKSEHVQRLNALVTLARSEPGIPIVPAAFDCNPYLLNVQNGTIDLHCGALRPHRRGDLISKLISLDYDADARCPRWETFLREVTSDRPELVDFLHRGLLADR